MTPSLTTIAGFVLFLCPHSCHRWKFQKNNLGTRSSKKYTFIIHLKEVNDIYIDHTPSWLLFSLQFNSKLQGLTKDAASFMQTTPSTAVARPMGDGELNRIKKQLSRSTLQTTPPPPIYKKNPKHVHRTYTHHHACSSGCQMFSKTSTNQEKDENHHH